MKKWSIGTLIAVLGLAIALVAAPAGIAKRGEVRVKGTCTGHSTSKLKLSDDNGRIELEFEVDQNRNGVRWNVVVFQNGKRIAKTTRITRAPSGSFEARVVAPNRAGLDKFVAKATRASGEACTARASI